MYDYPCKLRAYSSASRIFYTLYSHKMRKRIMKIEKRKDMQKITENVEKDV